MAHRSYFGWIAGCVINLCWIVVHRRHLRLHSVLWLRSFGALGKAGVFLNLLIYFLNSFSLPSACRLVQQWRRFRHSPVVRMQLMPLLPPDRHIPWKRVWSFRGPFRASFTIWAILHHALHTVVLLWKRGILASPVCLWCGLHEEFTLHLLRDCTAAKAVWQILLPVGVVQQFFQTVDVVRWISTYLARPNSQSPLPQFGIMCLDILFIACGPIILVAFMVLEVF